MVGVADGHVPAPGVYAVVIGVAFIGVEQRGRPRVLFDLGLEGRLARIVTDRQPEVARGATDHTEDGRSVVVHRPKPASMIGAATRWVVGIIMFFALFTSVLEHFIGFGDRVSERDSRFVIQG